MGKLNLVLILMGSLHFIGCAEAYPFTECTKVEDCFEGYRCDTTTASCRRSCTFPNDGFMGPSRHCISDADCPALGTIEFACVATSGPAMCMRKCDTSRDCSELATGISSSSFTCSSINAGGGLTADEEITKVCTDCTTDSQCSAIYGNFSWCRKMGSQNTAGICDQCIASQICQTPNNKTEGVCHFP